MTLNTVSSLHTALSSSIIPHHLNHPLSFSVLKHFNADLLSVLKVYPPEALNFVSNPELVVDVENFATGEKHMMGTVNLWDKNSRKEKISASKVYVGDFSQSLSEFDMSCYPFDYKTVYFPISIRKLVQTLFGCVAGGDRFLCMLPYIVEFSANHITVSDWQSSTNLDKQWTAAPCIIFELDLSTPTLGILMPFRTSHPFLIWLGLVWSVQSVCLSFGFKGSLQIAHPQRSLSPSLCPFFLHSLSLSPLWRQSTAVTMSKKIMGSIILHPLRGDNAIERTVKIIDLVLSWMPFPFPSVFWLPATSAAMKRHDSMPTGPKVQVPILFPCLSVRIFLTVGNLFALY